MKPVFADTAFFVAISSERDEYHAKAKSFAAQPTLKYVTTEFVLLEVANFFRRPGDRDKFLILDAQIRANPNTTLDSASSEL